MGASPSSDKGSAWDRTYLTSHSVTEEPSEATKENNRVLKEHLVKLLNESGLDTAQELSKAVANVVGGGTTLGGYVMGGGPEGTSSYSKVQDYGNSMYSKAKETLIRNIARDVFKALKVSKANVSDSTPLDNVLQQLNKIVPKGGPKFTSAVKANQEKLGNVCKTLANAINKNYGGNVINLDASPTQLCQQVGEVMHTLLRSLNSEFLTVAGDIARSVNNLRVLQTHTNEAAKRQLQMIQKSGSASQKMQAETLETFRKALDTEVNRQLAILGNSFNAAVGSTGQAMILSLEGNKDLAGLVRDLKLGPNRTAFGDQLATLLSGARSVAYSAHHVNNALKALGMSVAEYKNTNGLNNLRQKVYDVLVAKSPNSKELGEMMAAAEILYKNDLAHDDIANYLSKKGGSIVGGSPDLSLGVDWDIEDKLDADEADIGAYWQKKSLSAAVRKQRRYRKLLFLDFRKRLRKHHQGILSASRQISSRISKDITVDDNLEWFVKQFSHMKDLDKGHISVVLTGWKVDSTSRTLRENFIGSLEAVIQSLEPLCATKAGVHFKNLQNKLKDLIKELDTFSDKIVKSISEVDLSDPNALAKEVRANVDEYYGGGVNDEPSEHVSFDQIKKEMDYYLRLANLREDLRRAAAQSKSYGETYDEVLGDEAGWMITQIHKLHKTQVPEDDPTSEDDSPFTSYAYLCRRQRDAKVNLILAAQAVDLYLKAFTDAMASNPDTVKDLAKLLEQVEVVMNWFNLRSGLNLARVYDTFNGNAKDDIGFKLTKKNSSNVETKTDEKLKNPDHYYAALDNTTTPKPKKAIVADKEGLKAVFRGVEKAVNGVRALENILSVFSSLGSKFGTLDISSKTFLPIGQIYQYLNEYIIVSSLHGTQNGDNVNNINLNIRDNSNNTQYNKGRRIDNGGLDAHPEYEASKIVGKASIGADTKKSYNQQNVQDMQFNSTDEMFQLVMKSVVAKILTVIDVYRMFTKPLRGKYTAASSATRMILGGAPDPEVIPDALELYLRLPLLGEWYRQTFAFDRQNPYVPSKDDYNNTVNWYVALPPSVAGIWRPFCELIFNETKYMDNDASYTETQTNNMIKALNEIYRAYKKAGATSTRQVINAFVTEINRVYGMLTLKDKTDYEQFRRDRIDEDTGDFQDDLAEKIDYDILDAKDTVGRRAAPSDKYSRGTFTSYKKKKQNIEFHKLQDIVRQLRTSIDENMIKPRAGSDHFHSVFQRLKHNMKQASSPKEKYQVVKTAIQGVDQQTYIDEYVHLAFDDLVQAPLDVLKAIQTELTTLGKNVVGVGYGGMNNSLSAFRGIMNLSTQYDKLVEVSMNAGKPKVDFSGLQEACEQLLVHVKSALGKLKTVFEINNTQIVKAVKECNDLQEKLIDKMFKGRDQNAAATKRYDSIHAAVSGWNTAPSAAQVIAYINSLIEQRAPAAVRLDEFPLNIMGLKKPIDQYPKATQNAIHANSITEEVSDVLSLGDAAIRYYDNFNANGRLVTGTPSLVQAFNTVLAHYLYTATDVSNKLYKGVAEGLANGPLNQSVMGDNNFNDTAKAPSVPENKVLFKSLALFLKRAVSSADFKTSKRHHIFETLAEVPEHIKERLKANLPIYATLMKNLETRAELLRKMLSSVDANGHTWRVLPPGNNILEQLRHLSDAARAVCKNAQSVYKELNDVPLYMETQKGFYQDYKDRTNELPLTRVKTLSDMLKNPNSALPDARNGSNVLKFLYGIRGVISRHDLQPNLDHMPAVKEQYRKADSATNRTSIPLEDCSKNTLLTVKLARFVIQFKSQNSLLNPGVKSSPNVTDIINDVEDVDRKAVLLRVVSTGRMTGAVGDRSSLRIANILDMNIVPINVHAFMREVPFINLINYSHTFDQLVSTTGMFQHRKAYMGRGEVHGGVDGLNPLELGDPVSMMRTLLLNPNVAVDDKDYTSLDRIFKGDTGFDLGRPKYLSDHMWHSIMFQNPFENREMRDSSGEKTSAVYHRYAKAKSKNTKQLVYRNNKNDVVEVNIATESGVWKENFNTALCRNIMWTVNLQRFLRMVMKHRMEYVEDPVSKHSKLLVPNFTEYFGNKNAKMFSHDDDIDETPTQEDRAGFLSREVHRMNNLLASHNEKLHQRDFTINQTQEELAREKEIFEELEKYTNSLEEIYTERNKAVRDKLSGGGLTKDDYDKVIAEHERTKLELERLKRELDQTSARYNKMLGDIQTLQTMSIHDKNSSTQKIKSIYVPMLNKMKRKIEQVEQSLVELSEDFKHLEPFHGPDRFPLSERLNKLLKPDKAELDRRQRVQDEEAIRAAATEKELKDESAYLE